MSDNPPEQQNLQAAMEALQGHMQTLVAKMRADTGIPGICLALDIAGRYVFASTGTRAIDDPAEIDENAHFQAGCISKLLTALVAAELIEAGKCDPDDPIEKYLHELRGTERGGNLAIWHLLSHTSGYRGLNISDPGVAYYYSWPECVEFLKNTPQLFKPGSVFSYEHAEYAILTKIIERITGADILDLYREMIFQPLGITPGSVKVKRRGDEAYAAEHSFNRDTMKFEKVRAVPFGDFWNGSLSGITLTMRDLLRIASTICGISAPPATMSEKAIKFTHKQVVKIPRTYGSVRHEQIPVSFGAGCAFYRGWLLGHNGSARGQACGLRFDPQNNIALVIGINAWQPFFRDLIVSGIFGMLRGRPIPPLPEESLEFSLKDLSGIYIGPKDCTAVVECEGEQLACTLHDRDSLALRIMMRRDENGVLGVFSDTQHYSLGFFREPDSGTYALMLGTLAFRKQ
ncbi:MAG: beta-lactamase family protein [Acidobacteriota bacterium]|jgi:CubicO group peptidase (beta-lactamase class C family)|nr:beta-lactamase family protein [Acidobacteriota bacterium]